MTGEEIANKMIEKVASKLSKGVEVSAETKKKIKFWVKIQRLYDEVLSEEGLKK